jgi:hypothetical protein
MEQDNGKLFPIPECKAYITEAVTANEPKGVSHFTKLAWIFAKKMAGVETN